MAYSKAAFLANESAERTGNTDSSIFRPRKSHITNAYEILSQVRHFFVKGVKKQWVGESEAAGSGE
jgi:hypothetical protein